MFNNALGWFGYFALGYLTGKPLINALCVARQRNYIIAIFVISWLWVDLFHFQDLRNLLLSVRKIAFTMLLLSLLSFFNQAKGVTYLKYVGEQSLVVLGSHLWILIPILRICHKLFGSGHVLIGGAMALVTLVLSIPLIRFLNRKLPMFVGAKTPITQPNNSPAWNSYILENNRGCENR
jgi:membrane-associated phospholipid phosphatase